MRGLVFHRVLLWRPTCMHNALIARIPIRNARREIRKCPMKSSEDYLKSTTKSGPAAGREPDVAAQLNGHWPACYACCRAADAVIPPGSRRRFDPWLSIEGFLRALRR